VGDPEKGFAFPIRPTAWGGSHGLNFDARRSAATGWLAVNAAGFPENTLERALAYRPLYYRRGSLPTWAILRPSAKRLGEATCAIVRECKNAGKMVTRSDFVAELVRRTRATKRQALTYWPRTPKDWRRRGPKRRG
jgi:hypothetical protein